MHMSLPDVNATACHHDLAVLQSFEHERMQTAPTRGDVLENLVHHSPLPARVSYPPRTFLNAASEGSRPALHALLAGASPTARLVSSAIAGRWAGVLPGYELG